MLQRFVLTLMSSWIVNPIAILVAQWFGVANSPEVILVLLATGACVPFQLFMNECMATSAVRGASSLSPMQIVLVLIIQAVACAGVLLSLTAHKFVSAQVVFTVVALVGNTLMSYKLCLTYFGLVVRGQVPLHSAVIVGALPGISSLILYLIFCLTSAHNYYLAVVIIISTVVLPGFVQMAYIQRLYKETNNSRKVIPARLPVVNMHWLLAALFALAGLVTFSTYLRESVAMLSMSYVAVLLVSLNAMQSLIITFTRANFIEKGGDIYRRIMLYFILALSVMLFFGLAMEWRFWPLIGLLIVQVATAFIIELSRRIPAIPRYI